MSMMFLCGLRKCLKEGRQSHCLHPGLDQANHSPRSRSRKEIDRFLPWALTKTWEVTGVKVVWKWPWCRCVYVVMERRCRCSGGGCR